MIGAFRFQPFLLARANHTGTQAVSTVAGLQAIIDGLNASVAALDAAVANAAARSPTGAVTAWSTNTAPSGYLICNGAAVSRTTYAALFAVIGGTYGPGDGSTTFNLPDLRGAFVRGLDNGRGLDAGRTLGSYQDSDNKSHAHGVYDPGHGHELNIVVGSSGAGGAFGQAAPAANETPTGRGNARLAGSNISIVASGGNESRPRNVALNYIIKT